MAKRQKRDWQIGADGMPEVRPESAPAPAYRLPTPEEHQAGIMARAAEFSVTRKPDIYRAGTIAQAAAQAAAWASEGGRTPLIYALAEDGASALVPEAIWRDALTRACLALQGGGEPAAVIASIKMDTSLIGRIGSHKH